MSFDVFVPEISVVAHRFSPGLRFLVVGGFAAAVHYAVSVIAHGSFEATPWVANLIGFGAAFPLSYAGHRNWSFAGTRVAHFHAAPRFFAVSLGAFATNQVLLEFGLRWVGGPFWIVLAVVLVAVAAGTYVLARSWAFSAWQSG